MVNRRIGENTSGIIWPVIHGAPEKMHKTPIISSVSALLIAPSETERVVRYNR